MTYYPTLHTLRGFAAIWVLLFHTLHFAESKPVLFTPFYSFGWLGVSVFYLLSAFLLGSIYFQQKQTQRWRLFHFYKKRFLRIFPAYYFQLIIVVISSFWGLYKLPETKDMIAHLFMFFNLPPTNTQQLNGVWWTLPVEFAFYLILPLMGLLITKIKYVKFLFLSLALTLIYKICLVHFSNDLIQLRLPTLFGQLPGVFFTFSLGLSASYVVYYKIFTIKARLLYIVIPLIFIWNIVLLNTPNYWSGSSILYYWQSVSDVLFMLFILAIFKTQNRLFNNNLLTWLGKISYGIYLWHLPIILVFKDKFTEFYSLLLITIPLTLILASLSYYLIERKFSKLKV